MHAYLCSILFMHWTKFSWPSQGNKNKHFLKIENINASPAPWKQTWIWKSHRQPKTVMFLHETFNAVLKQSYQILNCCLSLLVDLICPYVWPFGLLSLAFRHSRVHGPRDVWRALWRVSGCVCLWHVYAGDGHIRISLLGVPECCPDLQKSHQRESCFSVTDTNT